MGYVECDVRDQTGKLVARAASTCMKLREAPPALTSQGGFSWQTAMLSSGEREPSSMYC